MRLWASLLVTVSPGGTMECFEKMERVGYEIKKGDGQSHVRNKALS